MSENKLSLAEVRSIPFEYRCAEAGKMLEFGWTSISNLAENDLSYLELKKKSFEARSSKSENPVFQQCLKEVYEQSAKTVSEESSKDLNDLWESTLKLCRSFWGNDATEFALQTFKKTHSGN